MSDQTPALEPVAFRIGDAVRRARARLARAGPESRAARRRALREAGYVGPRLDLAGIYGCTDAAFLATARMCGDSGDGTRRGEILAEMNSALAAHRDAGWSDRPTTYHQAPAVPAMALSDDGAWVTSRFESQYAVPPSEPGAARWNARSANRIAMVHLHRVPGDRPWLVLIHGAGMGQKPLTDRRVFAASALARQLDINIAMPILAIHGPRRASSRMFHDTLPSLDTLDTLHGLSQSVLDVRCVLAWIRSTTEAPIGLYGLSLGGYAAAAVTALDAPLACVIVRLPLVDPATVTTSGAPGRIREAPWFNDYSIAVRQVLSVVSPAALPIPSTPADRLSIYAGVADRVVPPLDHAAVLARRWGVPVRWFRSSHTSHILSRHVRNLVVDTMREHLLHGSGR